MTEEERLDALNQVLSKAKVSLFYSRRLPELPLKSLADLEKIPLTRKEDLRLCSPWDLLCTPQNQLYQYHETFGTTGTPISIWYTKEDFILGSRCLTKWGVNFGSDDLVLIRFPYAISTIAHFVHEAAHMQGACVIAASSRTVVSPYTRIIRLMRKLGVTVLACLPLQAVLLAETAEVLGLKPGYDFPRLRAVCTAGEALPPKRRMLIKDIWQVPVYDNYGMTEIGPAALDCTFGISHPLEEYYHFEVLDESLSAEAPPGQTGYLVVTTLRRTATPIIRYLTGDRARLVQRDCACGQKISLEIRGRKEDLLNINNRQLDRWDLEEIIASFPCRRFWAAGPVNNTLQIIAEKERPGDQVSREMLKGLEEDWQIPLRVELVPPGTLYDRSQLLEVGLVGKPKYIYTEAEMRDKSYLKSART